MNTAATEPSVATLARRLPKVELHCHLEGSARPSTVVELARRNGVKLPVDDPTELFHFSNLTEFLDVYWIVCSSLRTADDLRRITYESLQDASASGVRYREMFFSPGFLIRNDVTLDSIWAGIRAGLADAHADLDIRCRMILDVDKGADPAAATELVTFAAEQDRDELIGIGGDNTERGVDHRAFAPPFELAARKGLRRTMHAGEDGPSENIAISLEALGCERIDHGVRLIDDPALLARVARDRIPLTVCPLSNVLLTGTVPNVATHPFAAQRQAGVLVTINSDDPGISGTTIADDYEEIAHAFGYDMTTMAAISVDGIEASWAPEEEKLALRRRFEIEIAALMDEPSQVEGQALR
jgi:adenosine deaminase